MTWMDQTIMGLDHQEAEHAFGLAVGAALKRLHPHNTSGLVAQRLGCTKKAAENLLEGHLSARSITKLTKAYGLGFMIDVSAAVAGTSLEQFIRNRAADARREADRWASLEEQELPFDLPPASSTDRMAEPRSWDRRRT